jgi:glycyl-tRNA synthetase (class II)
MAKWEFVDKSQAPENLSGMSDDAKAKLEMLRSLAPGKVATLTVANKTEMRGIKASITRLAKVHGINVTVYDGDGKVCVELQPAQSDAESTQADWRG